MVRRHSVTLGMPPRIEAKIGELDVEIATARGELEDHELERVASSYEATAVGLFAKAAADESAKTILEATRASLETSQASLTLESAILQHDKEDQIFQAETMLLEAARLRLWRTYERCLALGIDPLAASGTQDTREAMGASLGGIISGISDLHQARVANDLHAAAKEAIGMIRWLAMLRILPDQQTTARKLQSVVTATSEKGDAAVEAFRLISRDLVKAFEDAADQKASVEITQGKPISFGAIEWLDRLPPVERDRLVSILPPALERRLDKLLLGIFRFRISPDYEIGNPPPSIAGGYPVSPLSASYVSVTDIRLVVGEGAGLKFIAIPPSFSAANPTIISVGGSSPKPFGPRQIVTDQMSLEQVDSFQHRVFSDWQHFIFTGAIGNWTFVVADTIPHERSDRAQKVDRLERAGFRIDSVFMPYIAVSQN